MSPSPDFRELCHRHHLAATHQRQVIYETVLSLPGHPSPEAIYAKVRRKIPLISLATVYKNLHAFLDSGMLQEVSMHHGSLRIETNRKPHHHLVCIRCKQITDLDEVSLPSFPLLQDLPRGFQLRRIAVDVLGICEACASKGA